MKMFAEESLEQFRAEAPLKGNWADATNGLWIGGRVYNDEFGDIVFIPLGSSRADCPASGPLTFLGDGIRNVRGWGDREAMGAHQPEIVLTNPVRP